MSKSPTGTDDTWSADPAEWLDHPHAGEMLQSEALDLGAEMPGGWPST